MNAWLGLAEVVLGGMVLSSCGDLIADATLSVDLGIETVSPPRLSTAGGQEVTIIGKNFAEGVSVRLGDDEIQNLVRQNDHRLSFVSRPMAFGRKRVVVANPSGGQVTWETELLVHAATIRFQSSTVVEAGQENLGMGFLVGDVDGDGLDDVVTARMPEPLGWEGPVVITSYLNRDRGQWFERRETGTGNTAVFETRMGSPGYLGRLGDVDGDGLADLVVETGIRFNRGGGLFEMTTEIIQGPTSTLWLARQVLGDFDGDGVLEIAAFETDTASFGAVTLFDVSATRAITRSPTTIACASPLAAVDLDGDGADDLISAACGGALVAFSFQGPSAPRLLGSWRPDSDAAFGPDVSVAVVNLDDDAFADLAVSPGNNMIRLLRGHGDGTFEEMASEQPCLLAPPTVNSQDSQHQAIHAIDSRFGCPSQYTCPTLLLACNGQLVTYSVSVPPYSSSWGIRVGGFPTQPGGNDAAHFRVANLDGDAAADIVWLGRATDPEPAHLGAWYGSIYETDAFSPPRPPFRVAAGLQLPGPGMIFPGDFGMLGTFATMTPGTVSIGRWNGRGLELSTTLAVDFSPAQWGAGGRVCDFDNDGTVDVAIFELAQTSLLRVFLVRDGGLVPGPRIPVGSLETTFHVGHFTGDERCELLVGNNRAYHLWRVNSDTEAAMVAEVRSETEASLFDTLQRRAVLWIEAADFDADGRDELVGRTQCVDCGPLVIMTISAAGFEVHETAGIVLPGTGETVALSAVVAATGAPASLWVVASPRPTAFEDRTYLMRLEASDGAFWQVAESQRFEGFRDRDGRPDLWVGDLDGDTLNEPLLAGASDPTLLSLTYGPVEMQAGRLYYPIFFDVDRDGLDDLALQQDNKVYVIHNESR